MRAAVAGLKEDLDALRGRGEAGDTGAGGGRPGRSRPGGRSDDRRGGSSSGARARGCGTAEEPAAAEAKPAAQPPAHGAPEGARVLALNMALDGTPREETARYLRENFELDDPDGLLDEVYASAGG